MPDDSMFPDYGAEAFVASGDGESVIPDDTRFVVDSTAKAEWAMQRLITAENEGNAAVAQRDEFVQRADRWFERVTARPSRTVEFMRRLLTDYHKRLWDEAVAAGVRERDLPRTVPLPSGDLTSRAPGPGRLVVEDEAALIGWLETNGAPVDDLTSRSIRKADLRESCVEVEKDGETVLVFDGQVVPHVRIEKSEERSWGVKPHG